MNLSMGRGRKAVRRGLPSTKAPLGLVFNTSFEIQFDLKFKACADVDFYLDRVVENCKLLCQDLENAPETRLEIVQLCRTVQLVQSALLDPFDKRSEYVQVERIMSKCAERLKQVLTKITSLSPPDEPAECQEQLYRVIQIMSDIHQVECLTFLDASPDQFRIEDSEQVRCDDAALGLIQKQLSIYRGRQQMAIAESHSTESLSSDDSGCGQYELLSQEQIQNLASTMKPDSDLALRKILACDDCLRAELDNVRNEIYNAADGFSQHQAFSTSRLRFLMQLLEDEMAELLEREEPPRTWLPQPNPRTTPEISVAPCVADENADATDDNWMDMLELADTADDYTDLPLDLLQAIERISQECGLSNVEWSQSTKSAHHLFINAIGINAELKSQLESDMKSRFPNFVCEFIDSEATSQKLTGTVTKNSCNKTHLCVKWEGNNKATSELLLIGEQPHKDDRKCLYVATSAHLLLYEEEMRKVERPKPEQPPMNLILDAIRKEVHKRIDENVYTINYKSQQQSGQQKSVHHHLCNPPLISYRYYQDEHDGRSYKFLSDIAFIPIESSDTLMINYRLATSLQIQDSQISGIQKVTPDQLQRWVRPTQSHGVRLPKIYAAMGRSGNIVPMKTRISGGQTGLHIPFVLDSRCVPFGEGDSGSIIYLKVGQKQLAVGILNGRRLGSESHVYEATVLQAALDDLEHDYRHLVKSLKFYM